MSHISFLSVISSCSSKNCTLLHSSGDGVAGSIRNGLSSTAILLNFSISALPRVSNTDCVGIDCVKLGLLGFGLGLPVGGVSKGVLSKMKILNF